jgi:hypothetical protein
MYSVSLRLAFSMIVIVISICFINNSISFARQNDTHLPAQPVQPQLNEKSHSGGKDVIKASEALKKASEALKQVEPAERIEDEHMKCLQKVAETAIDVLIATRGVIAKNQELINRDPTTGDYSFKGFVPAVAGSQVSNDFSLMTGHRMKQTSLKLRNLSNAPDEWEKKALKFMDSSEYPKGVGFGEILGTDGMKIYRYMKPIYIEIACLQCHGEKEKIRPAIRQFIEEKYPHDEAFGYKNGDLRGGISIVMSLKRLGFEE